MPRFYFPVSWCSQDVAAGTDRGRSSEFKEDSSLLAHYSNNYHCLTKTNKQSIRKGKYKHIRQSRVILHWRRGGGRGASDRFNGFQMDRKCRLWKLCNSRWPGSVLAGRPARGSRIAKKARPGVGGMLIMERGEHVWQRERMENTCPISHLFTFDCQTPARLKEQEAGGGEATAKVEPFKVYLFDEDANSLIAFQTFRGGKRKPWRDRNLGLGGAGVHWQRDMCKDRKTSYCTHTSQKLKLTN